jgi:hypothetical protein
MEVSLLRLAAGVVASARLMAPHQKLSQALLPARKQNMDAKKTQKMKLKRTSHLTKTLLLGTIWTKLVSHMKVSQLVKLRHCILPEQVQVQQLVLQHPHRPCARLYRQQAGCRPPWQPRMVPQNQPWTVRVLQHPHRPRAKPYRVYRHQAKLGVWFPRRPMQIHCKTYYLLWHQLTLNVCSSLHSLTRAGIIFPPPLPPVPEMSTPAKTPPKRTAEEGSQWHAKADPTSKSVFRPGNGKNGRCVDITCHTSGKRVFGCSTM